MTPNRSLPLLLLAISASSTFAQTTPAKKPVHHAPSTSTAKAPARSTTTAAKPAGSGIPKVAGIPKTLYALKYLDLVIGTGPLAEPRKWYTVKYTGWLPDGTKFDSSFDHPGQAPIVFPYGAHQVISGWDTGFEGMHVGGKRRLIIPYQLAYGEQGRAPVIPPRATLTFDLELVSFSDTPPTPPAAPKPPTPPPASTPPTAPSSPGGTPPAPGSATPESKPATPPAPPAESVKPGSPPPIQNSTPDSTPKATPKSE